MATNKLGLWSICCLITAAVAGWIAPQGVAEEWEFFAAGTNSYRHYIDMDSIQWTDRQLGIASARFSSNQAGDVYVMTHYCDSNSSNYGTYLLDGYPQPLYLETVVESARSILCLSPCTPFTLPAATFIPERASQLADKFWASRRCPSPVPEPNEVS